ncbi:MFS transporter, partial [Vibrio parahaemolyticus]|nr:MFS transporter [Vibrio parahaemolyticus]
GELLVHEDEHSEPDESPTPQEPVIEDDPNELDLDTFKPAGDEPKTTPQRNAEEEAAELEALSQQIDGFNE